MIATIVNEIKRAVEAHKEVNGFTYDLPSKVLGLGEKPYPHFYLESPIYGNDFSTTNGGVVSFRVNVDVLMFGGDVVEQQDKAEKILYQVVSNINNSDILTIDSVGVMGLTRYTDDNTNGVRGTLTINVINDFSLCVDDNAFDDDRQFPTNEKISSISTTNAESCEGKYKDGLSKIDL